MPDTSATAVLERRLDTLFHQLITRGPNLSTRPSIRRALQDLGIDDSSQHIDRIEMLCSEHTYQRRNRLFRRAVARLNYTQGFVYVPAYPRLILPQGTPA